MPSSNFGTAINCIDGRIQTPIQKWLKDNFAIDNVDTITEHGVVRLFSNPDELSKIKSKVLISVEQSNSKIVVVSAHHDCEGDATKDDDRSQIKNAVSIIKSWDLPITVIGVWVNEQQQVEPVD
ncbi:MAG: hypothetical protein PVG77_06085 [Nitrosopumilaceae archaeon]|jgi:hypothetical protein